MKPRDIQERTYDFALRVIKLVSALPKSGLMQVLGRQLLRSGTSVGANVQEAQNALTRKEFAYSMNVARREAGESHYWLKLISEANIVKPDRLKDITAECMEIVCILGAIVKKASRPGKTSRK